MKIYSARLLSIKNLAFVINELVEEYLPEQNMLVIYRRFTKSRNTEVFWRLPDGIRYSPDELVLLKFTSDSQPRKNDFKEVLMYHSDCRRKYKAHCQTVQTVVISSQRLSPQTKAEFGYDNPLYPGVYVSQNQSLAQISVISLDELSLEHHNAWFKCFASQKAERKKAYEVLQQNRFRLIPTPLEPLLADLASQD